MVSVVSGEEEKKNKKKTMAMVPERSKPLHNFMLPCLKWGSQRHLRCMKVLSTADADAGDRRSPTPTQANNVRDSEKKRVMMRVAKSRIHVDDDDDEGIDAVREKLMLDLKTEADRMKDAILGKEVAAAEENDDDGDEVAAAVTVVDEEPTAAAAVGVRPWNLRTRRSACKAPNHVGGDSGNGKGLKIEEKKPNSSSSPKLRGTPEKIKKVKFTMPLSKKEIEDDFMALLGHRPPRRPKKRPRIVQKQLDSLFPGLWLSEVTADSYKVPEEPETGKR